MESKYKILLGVLGGAAVIGGVMYVPSLMRAASAAPELDTVPKLSVYKIDLTGITLRLDVNVKNPTKADFKMKYPYFRLTYNGETLGTSQSIDQDVAMPHLGEANFNNILFNIPLLSAFTVASALIKAAKSGQEVKMSYEVNTHIDPYWKYNDTTKTWSRLPNLGNASLIAVKEVKPVTLLKQKQA